MTRAKRLQNLLALELSREREAALELAASRQLVLEREQQLERLGVYRDDYASQSGETDRMRLIQYRDFLARLNVAIAGQQKLLEAARRDMTRRLEQWQRQRGQVKTMESALDRAETELRVDNQRREQRDGDEQGQRLSARRGEQEWTRTG